MIGEELICVREINRLSEILKREAVLALKDSEYTASQIEALHYLLPLAHMEIFQADFESGMCMDTEAAGRLLNEMEKKGLITQSQPGGDIHSNRITPTPKAWTCRRESFDAVGKLEAKLLHGIDVDDMIQFQATLHKMIQNFTLGDIPESD